MASFNNGTMRGFTNNGKYTTDELKNVKLDDGTRVVTSPVTDIKRPVCAGIDVHKSVLLCDRPENLKSRFLREAVHILQQ